MPILTTEVSDGAVREDLRAVIEMISPMDTPLVSLTGNVESRDVTHIWMTDTLTAAAANAHTEGQAVGTSNRGMPTRVSNTCQIMRKDWQVSDTAEAVERAGIDSAIAYQIMKSVKELARDTEFNLIQSTEQTNNDRQMSGLDEQISTVTFQGQLDETTFNNLQQSIWEQGTSPDTALVLGNQQRTISGFTTLADDRRTWTLDLSKRQIIRSVMIYSGDFAEIRIHKDRYNVSINATEQNLYMILRSMVRKAWLRPTRSEIQAKSGDVTPGLVHQELCLEVGNEAACGTLRATI